MIKTAMSFSVVALVIVKAASVPVAPHQLPHEKVKDLHLYLVIQPLMQTAGFIKYQHGFVRFQDSRVRKLKALRPLSLRLHEQEAIEPSSVIPHYQLWMCIHAGEGAWDDDTGNGYYGGLQMTFGWDGLIGNAALMSPMAQMEAAEEGFRDSGYSITWLEGQWPNTSPPCLQYA